MGMAGSRVSWTYARATRAPLMSCKVCEPDTPTLEATYFRKLLSLSRTSRAINGMAPYR